MPASLRARGAPTEWVRIGLTGIAVRDVVVDALSFAVASLCLAAVTLRRRTIWRRGQRRRATRQRPRRRGESCQCRELFAHNGMTEHRSEPWP